MTIRSRAASPVPHRPRAETPTRPRARLAAAVLLSIVSLLVAGCDGDPDSGTDAAVPDTGVRDGGVPMDGGGADAGPRGDGGTTDAAPGDGGSPDAGPVDPLEQCVPSGGTPYTPTSAAEVSDSANAGRTAMISSSFDCGGCTFAAGQTVIPAGGVISGTNIDLNGACVVDNLSAAFSAAARFSAPYDASRLSPEMFGAISGDETDDSAAIDALILNSEYATATADGAYIKNQPSSYDRAGMFDWDMNGASVRVTSSDGFDLTRVSVDAVFDITTLSPRIRNGEFDCGGVYGRLFFLRGQPDFFFSDLFVHDLYSPSPIRAVAFRFSIDVGSSGFTGGEFRNNRIQDIVSEGDGSVADTDGISKAWWYSISGVTESTTYHVVHRGNVVRNIVGDDAEAFYAIQGGGTHSHSGTWLLDGEDYSHCTRRAIKVCLSNVTLQNSRIEEIPDSLFHSPQQLGSLIDFFSVQSSNLLENITVRGNTIRTVDGSAGHSHLLSLTEVDGALITDNTIEMGNLENYSGVRLGSGSSSYAGVLTDIHVTGNTFRNCGVQLLPRYAPVGQMDVSDNTFNYTYDTSDDWGTQQAALRCTSNDGTRGNVDFVNNEITVDVPNQTSRFNGVIFSQGSRFVNTRIEGTTIRYLDEGVTRAFGYIRGNLDSSNTIRDCEIVGDIGTGALVVDGSLGATITNSFGDGSTPLTAQ